MGGHSAGHPIIPFPYFQFFLTDQFSQINNHKEYSCLKALEDPDLMRNGNRVITAAMP